ncbi:MAG: glycosyltransferase family 9 protein [Aquificaceae bacterium]|nr:glycosyltransferase family 9 protein [Aquificaceae bacterium]MCX8164221.1 glycosyltransferase family 9 protein [Aquificaceae bacterium]
MWLLYRRGGLGDTLLTFPILELLKRSGKRVCAVGNTDYFLLAKAVGWVDLISSEVPEGDFEERIIISFEGNLRPFPEDRVWIVEHYFRSLGFENHFSRIIPVEPKLGSPLEGCAVLHPSSGSPKKNPPLELFLRIEDFLRREGLRTLYLIGEADGWLKEYVKNYFESLSPLEMARALRTARLFVGADSGLSHLASYCGLPTFIFYGPTDPVIWKPIGERVFQIALSPPCSPCFPNVCDEKSCLPLEPLFEAFLLAYRSL